MRKILFRAKAINREEGGQYRTLYKNGDWVYGFITNLFDYKFPNLPATMTNTDRISNIDVDHKTIGQYTGLTDKNGRKIFEGDIIQYNTIDDFCCQSIVKIGEYNQDGSCGEYFASECYGVYVEVNNFTCPDWADNNPDYFSSYLYQQNLLEVAKGCEVIGNIHDNPELLEVSKLTREESIKRLGNLIETLGQPQYQSLWDWEQPLTEIMEMIEKEVEE